VTCGVLGFSKQAYSGGGPKPICDRDLSDAYLTNAAFDAHHDDPTFGYRFISDELETLGFVASENRVQRLCSMQSGNVNSNWPHCDHQNWPHPTSCLEPVLLMCGNGQSIPS
jgi:hypothetical protein